MLKHWRAIHHRRDSMSRKEEEGQRERSSVYKGQVKEEECGWPWRMFSRSEEELLMGCPSSQGRKVRGHDICTQSLVHHTHSYWYTRGHAEVMESTHSEAICPLPDQWLFHSRKPAIALTAEEQDFIFKVWI